MSICHPVATMRKLKAVFWDVDGTIAETELYGHRVAFNNSFAQEGLNWDWDIETYIHLLKIQGGKNRIKHYANSLKYKIDDKEINKLHFLKQDFYHKQVLNGDVTLRPGVLRLINELSNNTIKQFIVTTSGKSAVKHLISKLFNDNESPFSSYITYEDVINHKPFADAYLKAIHLSKESEENILVIEDSIAGYSSACRANIPCLITPPEWSQFNNTSMPEAKAVTNHLGEINNRCEVLQGLPCKDGIVTLEYLENLINLD